MTEAQDIISTINNVTARINGTERILEQYHNNFNGISSDIESINNNPERN